MIPTYLRFSYFAGKHIHLGVAGSIACYKALDLCREFIHSDIKVSATLTVAAQQFLKPLCFSGLGADPVYTDMFSSKNTPFAHLEPNQFADVFLIAPITANSIAKIATGLADDLLSCQALAFQRQILVAPAMNPNLWKASATQKNIETLKERGIHIILPAKGKAACGDEGEGKLAPIQDIYFYTLKALAPKDLEGKKILITLGPTREYWDSVRFISNPSSGKMGAALAVSAWLRGAHVTCIKGPCDVWLPEDPDMKIVDIISAEDLLKECLSVWEDFDIGCMVAAVCDFAPEQRFDYKLKKKEISSPLSLRLKQTPDILFELGKRKKDSQILIGFAAETKENFLDFAKDKLIRKNLDMIVANRVDVEGVGFSSDMNSVTILTKKEQTIPLPTQNKADIAWKIWDLVLQK